ncbi:MAG: hypothetical protein GF372_06290 [Candidatus Marinimicrobia bacterium]|nr:hypothetical protein [Candidatus Neomarinimicrobiota bacterium]
MDHFSLYNQADNYSQDIWILKVHDAEQRFAFWFQITSFLSEKGSQEIVFSVSYFNALNPEKENRLLTQRYNPEQCTFEFTAENGLRFESDSIVMTEHNSKGTLSTFHDTIKWNVNWFADPDTSFRYFSSKSFYRYANPAAKLYTPNPLLRIDGKISVGELDISLDSAPGIQSHVWGDSIQDNFIWLQCNAFEETDFAEIEALTFTPFNSFPLNPKLSVLRINLFQEQHIFNRVTDMFKLNSSTGDNAYMLAAESDNLRIQLQSRYESEFLMVQNLSNRHFAYTGIAGMQVMVSEKAGKSWSVSQKLTSQSGANLMLPANNTHPEDSPTLKLM